LDNLNGTILPASQRPDGVQLNDDDLWVQAGPAARRASNVRLWRDFCLQKLAKESR
jgi:hypothetical protein